MRKTTVRHLLHGILDLLPVILIPVFMIYSHRHTIDNYQVEYAQNKVVDFNQLYDYRLVSSVEVNGIYYDNLNDGSIYVHGTSTDFADYIYPVQFEPNPSSFYLLCISGSNLVEARCSSLSGDLNYVINEVNIITQFYLRVYPNVTLDVVVVPQIFNLTQMFGSGNEPTYQQFKQYYPNDYYEYTTSRKELLNVGSITYNDTDIGSQFMYCLYNSVDKYFNFNNVFNFNQIYDWFVLNIFNGNAPLIAPVVWNIILYEFIMDLMFLLYGLFMFFIDMCKRLIEKPINSIK